MEFQDFFLPTQLFCNVSRFRFPSDLHTYDIDRQLLLGGELLISPVLDEGADMVEAYVPDARWFDFYTGNSS